MNITDGNLPFEIWASLENAITSINLSKAVDYTLASGGTAATSASVALSGIFEIMEVDAGAVILEAAIQVPLSGMFSPSAEPSTWPTTPGWASHGNGSLDIDVDAILLAAGIISKGGATKVNLNLDNILVSISEINSVPSIANKDFDGFAVTAVIPEPTTALLLGLGLLGGYGVMSIER